TRGRQEGRPYPWSQQVIHVISRLKKFPGFSEEKVVSILWVVEVFTIRKLYPNVAYLPKKTVDSVAFWDPAFRGGGGIPAGKANHGET
ncbi:MAG: hypothetical protein ACERKR_12160, partial [Deltaproteobacteria bacterium]